MKVLINYLSVFFLLILLSSFTTAKVIDSTPLENPNIFPDYQMGLNIIYHNSDIKIKTTVPLKVLGADRVEYHISKHLKSIKPETIEVEVTSGGAGTGGTNMILDYYTVVLHDNLSDNENSPEDYVKINILKPKIAVGENLYFHNQPIRRKRNNSIKELIEIVEVANIKLAPDHCRKKIAAVEILQDSLFVAFFENGTWQEKAVYLPYMLITLNNNKKVIYRPYKDFEFNDAVIYDTDNYQINGITDTVLVSKWCNSDGYPHVIENLSINDHYDPTGCND